MANDGTTQSVVHVLAAACRDAPSCVGFHLASGVRLGTGALLYDTDLFDPQLPWPPKTPDAIAAAGGSWAWGKASWSGRGAPARHGSVAVGKGWDQGSWEAYRRQDESRSRMAKRSARGCCNLGSARTSAAQLSSCASSGRRSGRLRAARRSQGQRPRPLVAQLCPATASGARVSRLRSTFAHSVALWPRRRCAPAEQRRVDPRRLGAAVRIPTVISIDETIRCRAASQ